MADCYYHGYSGSPGRCPQCESGTRGLTLDSDEVQGLADVNSVGRAAVAKAAEAAEGEE